MSESSYSSDVIIAGGGIAGIVSALELLNLDKKVLLFERGPESELGGLAKISFGGMFFVDTPIQRRSGIKDTPELAFRDWCRVAGFQENDIFPKLWAKQYVYQCKNHVYSWLKQEGIRFFPVVHWVERGMFTPGNSYPRFHLIWGTGHELVRILLNNLKNHPKAKANLEIKYLHKVDKVLFEKEKAIGVSVIDESTNRAYDAKAKSIVIASGGIGGNIAKIKENWYQPWGKAPEKLLNGTSLYADGHLFEELEKENASLTHMDKMWPYAAGVHHPRPKFKDHGLSLVPPKSALWLNYKGERIGPMPLITAYDTRYLVKQICKQEKKYSWQILNLKIANKELAISGAEFNPALRDKKLFAFLRALLFGNKELLKDMLDNCVDFVIANSLEELTKKMNALTNTQDVEFENISNAISQYDENIERGPRFFNDDQLRRIAHTRTYKGDKVRTSKFQKIDDPKAGPLIAIREFIISRKTLGGLQTNLKCEVLNKQGEHISGLYSIGEAAGFGGGGMHGKGSLEGTFLGGCVLTGRVAAYAIAGKTLIKDNK